MTSKENIIKKTEDIIETAPYPISKPDLVEYVRSRGKGDDVVDVTSKLPHTVYQSKHEVIEVLHALNT